MAALHDALAYILKSYPATMRHELSNARVTKMIYLADWHQTINHKKQITNINWYFDNYGPYVNDIKNEAERNTNLFSAKYTNNMYGSPKLMLSLNDSEYEPNLTRDEIESLDHVINETKKMYWDSFIKLVYSTHPITSSNRYSFLDLVEKATEYEALKETPQ